jgi:hypothetical protein
MSVIAYLLLIRDVGMEDRYPMPDMGISQPILNIKATKASAV